MEGTALNWLLDPDVLERINPYLLQAEGFAAVAAAFGIIWESKGGPSSFMRVAHRCVILGVVAETAFSLLLFMSDGHIADAQRTKIVALEQKLAPRSIGSADAKNFVAELKPFAGQDYMLSVAPGAEVTSFACAIDRLLTAADWHRVDAQSGIIVGTACGNAETNILSGVNVRAKAGAPQKIVDAANALCSALDAAHVDDIHGAFDNVNIAVPTTILIMVGSKL